MMEKTVFSSQNDLTTMCHRKIAELLLVGLMRCRQGHPLPSNELDSVTTSSVHVSDKPQRPIQ